MHEEKINYLKNIDRKLYEMRSLGNRNVVWTILLTFILGNSSSRYKSGYSTDNSG
jgi:hypothetical protein